MNRSFFKLKIKKDQKTGTCIASLYYNGETRTVPYLDIPYEDYIYQRNDDFAIAKDTFKWLEEHLENKAAKLVTKGAEHVPTKMCKYIRSILPERSVQNAEDLRFSTTKCKGIPSLKRHVRAYEKYREKHGTEPVVITRYCDPFVIIETDGKTYTVESREGQKAEMLNAVKHNDISYYYMFTVPQIWDEVITDPGIPTQSLVATMLEVWSRQWEGSKNYKEKDLSLQKLTDFFRKYLNSPDIATDAYNCDLDIFGILVQSALLNYKTEATIDEYIQMLFDEDTDESAVDGFIIYPID